jgi:Kdo2-lipid IVA lauroyltransferase/acyltransferase
MYALAAALAVLIRVVFRYRVAVAADNLRRAMPELDAPARGRVLRAHYRATAEVLFELPRLSVIGPKELRCRMRCPDLAQPRADLEAGRPVLLLTAHQCNWEWLLQIMALELGAPFLAAYKPPHSAWADRLMLGVRSRFGAQMVPGKRLLREVLRRRGTAHVIGMVADQMPTSSPGRVWLNFLGRQTAFFPGPAELARAGGYRVYFLPLRRLRPGHYEAGCEPLTAPGELLDVPTLTARYAERVEAQVRARPADWTWTHRRWKLQPPAPQKVTIDAPSPTK